MIDMDILAQQLIVLLDNQDKQYDELLEALFLTRNTGDYDEASEMVIEFFDKFQAIIQKKKEKILLLQGKDNEFLN
ncbi:hypothetical protein NSA56_01935 [Oceanobacillus caeni]|uniref:hypothetical protein n=1 Tax=Oceanobacillus caeni TaxID=405946 RepID=UPI00214A8B39|nr:hypothetical protein [Oceanobacillus caeni]MCR1833157.1 hypothetical protein [Oceanobacillus caeni]